MTVDRIKARIMTVMRNLPPLPAVTRQLLVVIGDENASAGDVSKVLSSDPALAGKVLKLVNSSFYGVQQEVTTISRAVVLLGFSGVRNLALGFGSISALQKMGGDLDMEGFWTHSLANATAAQSLAPFLNRRTDPEEAFLAGLMHDIGAYVLASAVPDIYGEVLAEGGDRLAAEQRLCGMTHAQVGQGLLKFWDLPEAFTQAARYHHDAAKATDGNQPLTNLVAIADVLASVHGGSFETAPSEADLSRLLAGAGVSMENVHQALCGMDQKIDDMTSFLKIAGANVSATAKAQPGDVGTAVVVTTDEVRQEWISTLLKYMGYRNFAMESFFNSAPGSEKVGLVVVDPQCMTAQKFDQLMIFLSSQPAQVCLVIEHETNLPPSAEGIPTLDLVFSREDLLQVTDPQPA